MKAYLKKGQILRYADVDIYEGDLNNSKPSGKGVLRYSDGEIY
jgi:hypothetical protein